MQILGLIILFFVFVFLLIKSADIVVHSLRRFSRDTHTKVVILSTILLAVATSFPELFVGITSAIKGTSHLSFGNILGANIANISLVAGISALIVGSITIHSEYIRREVWIAVIAGIAPILLILDGSLSRIDGGILLAAYIIYVLSFFKDKFLSVAHSQRKEGYIHRFIRSIAHPQIDVPIVKDLARLFGGLILLLLSAEGVVRIGVYIAKAASVPIFFIGLFLLSIGTTLPELIFSIKSLKTGESSMFYGNILGSIIANSTLILGLGALIYPIKITSVVESIIAIAAFAITFFVFWFIIRKKLTVGRYGGLFLLILYFSFVIAEVWWIL